MHELRLANTGMGVLEGDPDAGWQLRRWYADPLGGIALLDVAARDVTGDSADEAAGNEDETRRVGRGMTALADKAAALLALHTAPEILVLANVWDVVSAQVVASTDGAKALATASHSIASTFGYEDGENIPLELHLDMVARIVRAVDLPVTMDFEAGYGDAGETARRAIEVGVVGANLEDQMKPLDEAVAAVEAVVAGRPRRRDRLRAQRPYRRLRPGGEGRRPR